MFENTQYKARKNLVYKGKKYDNYPEFQVYNQKTVPLKCLNMWDTEGRKLVEIEGINEDITQFLKLNRNKLSEIKKRVF